MTSAASLAPQLLRHPAIVLCEHTVPSRVVAEILAIVEFGRIFECRGSLVLTFCGSAEALGGAVQAIGCRSQCRLRFSARPLGSSFGQQRWLCGPLVGLWAAVCIGHERVLPRQPLRIDSASAAETQSALPMHRRQATGCRTTLRRLCAEGVKVRVGSAVSTESRAETRHPPTCPAAGPKGASASGPGSPHLRRMRPQGSAYWPGSL